MVAVAQLVRVPGCGPGGRRFEPGQPPQKETTIFERRLSFLFVLFTFLFSFFSLPSNCRFRIKDKREKRREKVALLRKALNYIIICGMTLVDYVSVNLDKFRIRENGKNIFFCSP